MRILFTLFRFFPMLTFVGCFYTEERQGIVDQRGVALRDSIFTAHHFDTTRVYSKPVCLLYNRKPLLQIGQNLSALPEEFSYRIDPNLAFRDYFESVRDFLSIDDDFMVYLNHGSVNGILFFAADARTKRVFYLEGDWLFDTDTSRVSTRDALDSLRIKVFPCLPSSEELLKKHLVKLNNGDFTESFELVLPDSTRSYVCYHLHYKVSLNSK